jgi:hypothetical protein
MAQVGKFQLPHHAALMAEWFNIRELAHPNRSNGWKDIRTDQTRLSAVPGVDLMIQLALLRSPGGQTYTLPYSNIFEYGRAHIVLYSYSAVFIFSQRFSGRIVFVCI